MKRANLYKAIEIAEELTIIEGIAKRLNCATEVAVNLYYKGYSGESADFICKRVGINKELAAKAFTAYLVAETQKKVAELSAKLAALDVEL